MAHRCNGGCGQETVYPDRERWRWRWGPGGAGVGLGRGRWTEALCPDCPEPELAAMRVAHVPAIAPAILTELPEPGPNCPACRGWIEHQALELGHVQRAWCRNCGRDWHKFTGAHHGHGAPAPC